MSVGQWPFSRAHLNHLGHLGHSEVHYFIKNKLVSHLCLYSMDPGNMNNLCVTMVLDGGKPVTAQISII